MLLQGRTAQGRAHGLCHALLLLLSRQWLLMSRHWLLLPFQGLLGRLHRQVGPSCAALRRRRERSHDGGMVPRRRLLLLLLVSLIGCKMGRGRSLLLPAAACLLRRKAAVLSIRQS
jgi:hypothetical protein